MTFLQNNNDLADNKMKWIENRKIHSKTVWIVLESLRVLEYVCVYACACMHMCVCVGYSCVLLCVYV